MAGFADAVQAAQGGGARPPMAGGGRPTGGPPAGGPPRPPMAGPAGPPQQARPQQASGGQQFNANSFRDAVKTIVESLPFILSMGQKGGQAPQRPPMAGPPRPPVPEAGDEA